MSEVFIACTDKQIGTTEQDEDFTPQFSLASQITPTAAFTMWVANGAIDSNRSTINMGWGSAEGTASGDLNTFFFANIDNLTDTDVAQKQLKIKSHWWGADEGPKDGIADFVSFTDDTVTYNVDPALATAKAPGYYAAVLMLGGADMNTESGVLDANLSQDEEVLITTGFDMTNCAILLWGTSKDLSWSAVNNNASQSFTPIFGMGAYDGTTISQACVSYGEEDNIASTAMYAQLRDDRIGQAMDETAGTDTYSLELTTLNSTQFGITARDAAPGMNQNFGYLAIGLPSNWRAQVTVETGASSNGLLVTQPTGFEEYTPQLLFQLLTLMTATSTIYGPSASPTLAAGFSIRFIGPSEFEEYCLQWDHQNNDTDTVTNCGIHTGGIKSRNFGNAGIEMEKISFIPGGWVDSYVENRNDSLFPTLLMGPLTALGRQTQVKVAVQQASTI